MQNRRTFIRQSALAAGSLLLGAQAGAAELLVDARSRQLTILHTNDTHSRIDPFPMDGSRNEGQGGVAARAAMINQIRSEAEHVLLLDAGDIFQGTPYFNIYKGEPEVKAMARMGYDACTIGNHDFDGGVDNLALQMKQHGGFSTIVSNYDFAGTAMESVAVPYRIIKKGGLKVGILGVGIELDGLVPANLYGTTRYLDPIQKANEVAGILHAKGCDLVICLSHLGYKYAGNKVSDQQLARETENINLIISGHTHTFLDKPDVLQNKKGQDVVVNQVGWAGLQLGRLDYDFNRQKGQRLISANPLTVTKKTHE
ncbi:5'-nucleotidase [Cnuella takakiae]|uniref:5'-nucleotidase n=1 Tax=Cnuella takakiae TaxID=1302690 RepID=A0A1M5CD86_9BACT|nr:metallophosphatase [Cnuella takakiae]OLY91769.1 metallophosphatase [Cnuella takakiae]SHF52679.1 5'-nucleotidase [Cnuella takakiae]